VCPVIQATGKYKQFHFAAALYLGRITVSSPTALSVVAAAGMAGINLAGAVLPELGN
jgi:hypothetical protein